MRVHRLLSLGVALVLVAVAVAVSAQAPPPPPPEYGTPISLEQAKKIMAGAEAEATIALATTHGVAHRVAQGQILQGGALAMQGDAATGVAQITRGWEAVQRLGQQLYRLRSPRRPLAAAQPHPTTRLLACHDIAISNEDLCQVF